MMESRRIELERTVIAYALLDKNCLPKFVQRLRLEDFKAFRDEAEAIMRLYKNGQIVDYITVATEMQKTDAKMSFKEHAFALMEITDPVNVWGWDFDKWAALLNEESLKDMARWAALKLVEDGDVFDAVSGFHEEIIEITSRMRSGSETTTSQIKELEQHVGRVVGYGFPSLGLEVHETNLVIVAARPGMGKTSFALKCALNIARKGVPIGFVSIEMGTKEVTARMLGLIGGLPANKILWRSLNQAENERLDEAKREYQSLPITVVHMGGNGDMVLAKCNEMIAVNGAKAIFVDYLQLMKMNMGRGATREQEVSLLSRNFKVLASESNVPVMLLSQLSRQVESRGGKMPNLSDLRDSGSIEQDADVVIMMMRPVMYGMDVEGKPAPADLAFVNIEKNRNGPTSTHRLRFIANTMDFCEFESETPNPFL